MNPQKLALDIAKILYEKQAKDITVLQVDHLTSVTDYFVIATGRSAQAVRALAEDLQEIYPRRKEGFRESRWIVLDYSSVIVHIFHPEEREYYNIERLWTDGSNRVALHFQDE